MSNLPDEYRKAALLASEEARCRALVDRDFETLHTLLSPDLTHTHTSGNTEDYNLYLELLQGPMRYISIKRRDLTIRFYGPVAIMHGNAATTGRLSEGELISINTNVLQNWVEENGRWRMVAFQATRIA